MSRALLVALLLVAGPASAHEVRPAYLELREGPAGIFEATWMSPMRGDFVLRLEPGFSGRTAIVRPATTQRSGDTAIRRWKLRTVDPLRGQVVRIAGLEATLTDAVVRLEFADGSEWTQRLTPWRPEARIPVRETTGSVAGVYLKLGFEHILLGLDHLLFVLTLLLLTHGGWTLVKTVTAFTLAHSITLGLATLGFVRVPPQAIEVVIALSIVFVAAELLYVRQGRPGLAARAPWIVAFLFGLLHGFGFAGALTQIGLPADHVPAALLFFNLGVEGGQLVFVALALSLGAALRRVGWALPARAESLPAYVIGGVATAWLLQRIAALPILGALR